MDLSEINKTFQNVQEYVLQPNEKFDINEIDILSIFQENSNKCISVNHQIEKINIRQINNKIIEVYVKQICDIVFDFEITCKNNKLLNSNLICNDITIYNDINTIKYKNAFPIISSGCNYVKLRLEFINDVNDCKINCKYGFLPLELKTKLQKLDILEVCEKMKKDEWILC